MKVTFTGDTSFTGNFQRALTAEKFDFDDDIKQIFKESDYNIVNLEGPAVEKYKDNRSEVISPLESIKFLSDMQINIFNLANNHTFDLGLSGFIETKNAIRKEGGQYIGAGENIDEASSILYLNKGDVSISIIAVGLPEISINDAKKYHYGVFSDNNITLIEEKVKEAKNNSDWVVLNMHNGTEYNFYPVDYIIKKIKKIIDYGVDVVICHHPHVPQGIEKYNESLIFYSLGNFVFDLQYHRKLKYTNLSILTTITFKKSHYSYEYVITEFSNKKDKIIISRNVKHQEHIEKLSRRLKSKYFTFFRYCDTVRSVLFNPIFGDSKKSNLLYPILLLLRLKGHSNGNARSLLKILLNTIKLEFIYTSIPGDETLSEKNDY